MEKELMVQTEKLAVEVIYNRLHYCLKEKIPVSKDEKVMIAKILAIITKNDFLIQ